MVHFWFSNKNDLVKSESKMDRVMLAAVVDKKRLLS